jgi:hypothetical protein
MENNNDKLKATYLPLTNEDGLWITARAAADLGIVSSKLIGRRGNKGVVTSIINDASMPENDGQIAEIILSPLQVYDRIRFGSTITYTMDKNNSRRVRRILRRASQRLGERVLEVKYDYSDRMITYTIKRHGSLSEWATIIHGMDYPIAPVKYQIYHKSNGKKPPFSDDKIESVLSIRDIPYNLLMESIAKNVISNIKAMVQEKPLIKITHNDILVPIPTGISDNRQRLIDGVRTNVEFFSGKEVPPKITHNE